MRAKQFTRRVNEGMGDSDEANAVVAEVIKLIGEGHTEVSPDVITTKVSAALGHPFMLKDLVAVNHASPELQHYIDSINPSKIKFSTDILTVKNEDPAKAKEKSEAGVANMAARAASRSRLGESELNEHGDQEDYKPWGSQDLEPGQKAVQGKPVKDTKKFTKDLAKDFGKHLGQDDDLEEASAEKTYVVNITKRGGFGREDRTRSTSGTIPELLDYFGYTLEVGKAYEHERGRYKINMTPKNIKSLVDNLNKAASNGASNGAANTYYTIGEEHQITEGRVKDVAIDLKELSDEEFLKKYKKTKAEMRSALSEGWGADAANARHAEQQSDWDKTLEKHKDDPKMTSRLKHLRAWKASEAEKAAQQGYYMGHAGRAHKFPGEDDVNESVDAIRKLSGLK